MRRCSELGRVEVGEGEKKSLLQKKKERKGKAYIAMWL